MQQESEKIIVVKIVRSLLHITIVQIYAQIYGISHSIRMLFKIMKAM